MKHPHRRDSRERPAALALLTLLPTEHALSVRLAAPALAVVDPVGMPPLRSELGCPVPPGPTTLLNVPSLARDFSALHLCLQLDKVELPYLDADPTT